MTCPRCRQDTPPGARLCPKCGASLRPSDRRQRPPGLDPNLNAIAKTAARLCDAHDAQIYLADSATLRLVAQHGSLRTTRHLGEPFPLSRSEVHGRAVLERRVIHVRDMKAAVRTQYPGLKPRQRATGIRTMLAAPLLSEGAAIGVIVIRRLQVRPFTSKQIALLEAFAEHAATAIDNTRLAQVQAEALEQQTATSEILGVISSSPTDVQPVFNAIAENAARLCDAAFDTVNRFDGELTTLAAHYGVSPETLEVLQTRVFPFRPTRENASGRALLDRAPVHVHDIQSDPEYSSVVQALEGYRTVLSVPMLREGTPIGTITLWRREMRPFSDKQIEMVKTFARQAVIAIENVRLFRDLTEALEQQTATSEILRVISSSPTTLDPVLEAVVKTAARLCDASNASLYRVEGDLMRKVAGHGSVPSSLEVGGTRPLTRGTVSGRAILERRTVHFPDLLAVVDTESPDTTDNVRREGVRTFVSTPLLREGVPIGAIAVYRTEVRPFSDKQIALLRTFADQAVIAIENVRLFKELEGRNRDLTVALDRQTATSEILRVIGSSPTDAEPVFDAIVRSAVRLLGGFSGAVLRLVGDDLHLAAITSTSEAGDEAMRGRYPRPLAETPLSAQVVRERAPSFVKDLEVDPLADGEMRDVARARGFRSMLQVPMLREDTTIGVIAVTRREPGPFADEEIALLQTFADQAVIAIENVRLFKELEARNRDLTEALEQQTATAEILRAISSSPTNVEAVFDTILANALRLCDTPNGAVFTFDGQAFQVGAATGVSDAFLASLRAAVILPGPETPLRRAGLELRVSHVADILSDPSFSPPDDYRREGMRTALAVPMLKEGRLVGALTFHRYQVRPFTNKQIALLRTFADQAVIAIENVRLFKELEARNLDLTEALEQQTATSEILGVISASPTDVQPVFDTIVNRAGRLCNAESAVLYRFEGEIADFAAHYNLDTEAFQVYRNSFPCTLVETDHLQRVMDGSVLNIADIDSDPHTSNRSRGDFRSRSARSTIIVPMLREGRAIGAISATHRDLAAFSDKRVQLLKTFADQAVIAIENVRLFKELEARNRALTEALEQQTATGEILRVISRSQTDVQPVFDTIARSAVRLCDGLFSSVYQFDGALIDQVAQHNYTSEALAEVHRTFPTSPSRALAAGRVILERAVVQIPDVELEPEYRPAIALAVGARSIVCVPMLREAVPVGAIAVARIEPGLFSDNQIELLKTFADQAVIAIENVRLFKELEARNRDLTEALEQQTATAEILRVISTSPTNLQPVLDTVVASAARFCGAYDVTLFQVDGDSLRFPAHYGPIPVPADPTIPLVRGHVTGRAVLERRVVHLADAQAETEAFPNAAAHAKAQGHRTILGVPLLREGAAIGALTLRRTEVDPFTDKQVALLQTFADQAVIAIENVRLFKELEARNRDLTEALEQQTATGEILRVISQSQTDVQPVFDTIVRSAVRLCDGLIGTLYRFDGELIDHVAHHNYTPEALDEVRRIFPMRPSRALSGGRAILERAVIHLPDVELDPEYRPIIARATGTRSILCVPMLRDGAPVGAIAVGRAEPGPFSDNQIELLKTFADQAVIAIENARLFKELQARTAELARSVEELRALGEVGRAVSSTLDLETVLTTIVSRAVDLSETTGGIIYEFDESSEELQLRASHQVETELVEALRGAPIRLGEGATGRAAALRTPVQVMDLLTEREFAVTQISPIAEALGYRSVLAVPLLLEDRIMGGLTVWRKQPGRFAPEAVNLLQTFAAQSSLAIQNARLFRELEEKGHLLEVASRHKSQFLANMSHELRTPLNAILGYTELLQDGIYGQIPEKAQETMERVARSGRHLLALINDVLDLSKIEAGQLTLSLGDYSLKEVVQTVVTAMEPLAAEKKLALRVTLAPDLPVGRGDDRRLSQVLLNLVGNAVKFTDAGEVRVAALVSDGAFVVSVSDTGPGIAPEDQQRIFEEFQQADTSNTRKKGGTGLGLSIARRIIGLHGGELRVESAPGKGSTFTFTVPVRVERMAEVP